MTDNLQYWNTFNKPPNWSLKEIKAGRLKGMSDINPQWRYYAMTSTFGPVGLGWRFSIDRTWTEPAAKDEVLAFAQVSVYVKYNGEWSDAIEGIGGSKLTASESNGLYNSDECFKMAITDALSAALKMIGVAADVYMGVFDGKHGNNNNGNAAKTQATDQKKERVWTVAQKNAIVTAKYADNVHEAKAMLDLSVLPVSVGVAITTSWAKYYRGARDEGKSSVEAAQFANETYTKAKAGK